MTTKTIGIDFNTLNIPASYPGYSDFVVQTEVNPFNSGYGATGVNSTLANLVLTNDGLIEGWKGGPAGVAGGLAGGIGVNLAASGDTFTNAVGATVEGGVGGGTPAHSAPNAGPAGGTGVNLAAGLSR